MSGSMAHPTLIRRAEAAGIAASYMDWHDQQVEVSDETLIAILDALDSAPGASAEPGGNGPGRACGRLGPEGAGGRLGPEGADAFPRPRVPSSRSCGFTLPLYSLRSRPPWRPRALLHPPDLPAPPPPHPA